MILKLANNLKIDTDEENVKKKGLRIAIIGESGSGKSWAASLMLEEALENQMQICVFDVHGEYSTFTEVYKNIIVIGGERADLPLSYDYIDVYIKIINSGKNVILDLKELVVDEEEFGRFSEKFLRALWKEQVENPKPLLLLIEEAHMVAPQEKSYDVMRRIKIMKQIATGGRKFGLFFVLTTQRPAEISKTALSQCWIRLFGKLTEELDLKAVKPYIDQNPAELRKLKIGEFLIFGLKEESYKSKIRSDRKTRDGASTPVFKLPERTSTERASIEEFKRMIEEIGKKKREKINKISMLEKIIEEQKAEIKKLSERVNVADTLREALVSVQGNSFYIPEEVKEKIKKIERNEDEILKWQKKSEELEKVIKKLSEENEKLKLRLEKFDDAIASLKKFFSITGIIPENTINSEELISMIEQKIGNKQKISINPPEALKKEFLEMEKKKLINIIKNLDEDEKKILKWVEAIGKQTTRGLINKKVFGYVSGEAYQNILKKCDHLEGLGLIKYDKAKRVYPNLKNKIAEDLSMFDATKEEIETLYQNVIFDILKMSNPSTKQSPL